MKPARTARIINYKFSTRGMNGKNNNFQYDSLVFFRVIKVQLQVLSYFFDLQFTSPISEQLKGIRD